MADVRYGWLTRILLRLYRIALRLLPDAFREPFATEMLADVNERLDDAPAREHPRVVWDALVDLAIQNVLEYGRFVATFGSGVAADLIPVLRSLPRNAGFNTTVVTTVGLGVGVIVAAIAVVDTVLLAPLPYPEPDEIAVLWSESRVYPLQPAVSGPDYFDYRDGSRLFQEMGAAFGWQASLSSEGSAPESVTRAGATASLLALLGAKASSGRLLVDADDPPDAAPVAVLSHALWTRRHGADPSVLGELVSIDGEAHRIIGVLEPGFRFWPPEETVFWSPPVDVWVNLRYDRASHPPARRHLLVVGRLAPGVAAADVEAEAAMISSQIRRTFADYEDNDYRILVRGLRADVVGAVAPILWGVLGAGALICLIIAANLSTVAYARRVRTSRELAVREALGASRWRITRHGLVEAALPAALGTAAGIGLAAVALGVLRSSVTTIPRIAEVQLDSSSLAIAVALGLAMTLLIGLGPRGFLKGGRLTGARPTQGLGVGGRSVGRGGRSGRRLLDGLVSAQVALCVVLLVGTGLVVRTALAIGDRELGYDPSETVTFSAQLATDARSGEGEWEAFYEELEGRIRALPGVTRVGSVNALPLSGSSAGAQFVAGDDRGQAEFRVITPGYFQTMGIGVVGGRSFDRDDRDEGAPAAIIDRSLALRLWGSTDDALGRTLRIFRSETVVEVVGVVESTPSVSLTESAVPQIYLPASLMPGWRLDTVVRASEPLGLVPAIRDIVREMEADVPVAAVRTGDSFVRSANERTRLALQVLLLLGACAVVMAAVGVYGVLSYVLGLRTREVGVRKALGAVDSGLLSMLLRDGLVAVMIGLVSGLLAAVPLTRGLESVLYEVTHVDPATYLGVAGIIVVVATLACLGPAWRASRLPAVVALGGEG